MCSEYYSTSVCWQDLIKDVFVKTMNNDFKRSQAMILKSIQAVAISECVSVCEGTKY